MQDVAWAFQRPGKKPADLKNEQWWRQELRDAGYHPDQLQHRDTVAPVSLDELSVQQVASRALDRCAAAASTWRLHTVREHVTRITTEAGVQATPVKFREFIDLATHLAASDCFSVLPPGMVQPEHVAHLTSVQVVAAKTALRDQLTAAVPEREPKHPNVAEAARKAGMRLPNPAQQAGQAQQQAAALRAEADYLRALPIRDAAARIEATRAEHEQRQQALAERERQLSEPTERDPRRHDPRRDGPAHGL